MSWKQLSCPVLLCLWLVTFISLIKFGALSLAVCFCQSAYFWTASENPSFHIFLTSELRVGGRGCVSQESNIHTHSSQWLARCVEVRRHSSCKLAFHPASECGSSTLSLRNYIYSAFLCGHDPRRHLFKSSWGSFLSSLSTITLW